MSDLVARKDNVAEIGCSFVSVDGYQSLGRRGVEILNGKDVAKCQKDKQDRFTSSGRAVKQYQLSHQVCQPEAHGRQTKRLMSRCHS
eukprot:scaffold50907_cov39-Prasinocladus_malaysianus.AAC.2